jgi:hypothetical protein
MTTAQKILYNKRVAKIKEMEDRRDSYREKANELQEKIQRLARLNASADGTLVSLKSLLSKNHS